jgi:hypothetical protein
VALHAIGGFVARVRDGFAEDVAEPDAWAAAVAAVRYGEGYRGTIPYYAEQPGFDEARSTAEAALAAHTPGTPAAESGLEGGAVRRFEWLTRHGMDPATAGWLAAADTAEERARCQARDEFNVLHEAETVIRDLQHELDPTYDAGEAAEQFAEDGFEPDVPAPEVDAAEQLAFDCNWDVADAAVELFERVRRYGRDADDAREDVLGTFGDDADAAVAGAALDRYSDHRAAGYDHDTARGLTSQEIAERLTPQYTTDAAVPARSIPDTGTTAAVADDPPVREEDGDPPPLAQRVAECGRAVDAADAALRADDAAAHELDEETERAERCARWNADDQAAVAADDDTEGWQHQ